MNARTKTPARTLLAALAISSTLASATWAEPDAKPSPTTPAPAALAPVTPTTPIKLEGGGPLRASLDALQNKPFDPALWATLTPGAGATLPTAESIKGKPVLIVTWASWYKASHKALKTAAELASSSGSDLIVLGVHNPRGFEQAADVAKEIGFTGTILHDAKGDFRKQLLSKQDPDTYVIDRAGNLRYARVNASSLASAVEQVVKETPEQAKEAAKAAAKTSGDPATAAKPGAMPGPEAYASAKWPKFNTASLTADDVQGKPLPKKLGNEKYLKGEAPDTTGKVIVIDFWATWCGPCVASMPELDKLQDKFKDDVVVIGLSDEEESIVKKFSDGPRGKNIKYAKATDTKATINHALKVQGIPHVVILSTDGIVRWQGHPAAGLDKALEAVVSVDPGVKARQAAAKK